MRYDSIHCCLVATEKTKLEVTTSFQSAVLRARRDHGAEKCTKQPSVETRGKHKPQDQDFFV